MSRTGKFMTAFMSATAMVKSSPMRPISNSCASRLCSSSSSHMPSLGPPTRPKPWKPSTSSWTWRCNRRKEKPSRKLWPFSATRRRSPCSLVSWGPAIFSGKTFCAANTTICCLFCKIIVMPLSLLRRRSSARNSIVSSTGLRPTSKEKGRWTALKTANCSASTWSTSSSRVPLCRISPPH